jgi:CcmD family protein
MRRSFAAALMMLTLASGIFVPGVGIAQNQTPPAQDVFVPIDELPPQEQVPAAPMVVAAYSFVWAAFVVYVFSLIKRVKKVEADLRKLEQGPRG